jgi:uncharacterized membrane protein
MAVSLDQLHALLFEMFGLALIIPFGTVLFGLHASEMGVIGVGSAIKIPCDRRHQDQEQPGLEQHGVSHPQDEALARVPGPPLHHAIEAESLALIIPFGTVLFGLHASEMGVIGVGSAITAAAWNMMSARPNISNRRA